MVQSNRHVDEEGKLLFGRRLVSLSSFATSFAKGGFKPNMPGSLDEVRMYRNVSGTSIRIEIRYAKHMFVFLDSNWRETG